MRNLENGTPVSGPAMTITTTKLTRAAAVSAVVSGLLFIAVQIGHPHLDANFVTTNEYALRQTMKVAMAVLALVGITGIYLRHVSQTGVLGLLGYVTFAAGFLIIMSMEVIGAVVLPSLAERAPGYVNDVLAVAGGGDAIGDIGRMKVLTLLSGVGYMAGGVTFGVALFRAKVLARWAAALLATGTLATVAIPLLPQVNQRLFAIPTGVALVGLGFSLWSAPRNPSAPPRPSSVTSPLGSAGVR